MGKKGLKIVTIGGGSSYTPELIEGYILRKEQLPIDEIVLVDIEEGREKLEIVGEMAKRQIKAAGLDWKVTLTLNRFEALKDADYVTTQFRVGLLDARVKDERIPLSHGILGQETNGAGGMFKAFRTIPVILDIIKDMEEQCPDAWLINFTNPAGMVTEAAIKHGGWERTLGLCNVPIGHTKLGAEALDIPQEELFFHYAGINHFHWHRIWDKDGNERTQEAIDKLYHPDSIAKGDMENIHAAKFPYEQIKDLEMLPCGYHRYYYIEDEMLSHSIEEFEAGETRAQVVKDTEKRLFELYKDPELDYKPEELTQRGGTHYSDAACEIIASIQNDKHTEMVVSTKNNGTIADLPYDSAVEVSGVVTANGFVPYNWGSFENPAARGMLQLMKGMEETVIRAAIEGDYGAALHAFTVNPLVPAGDTARTVLDQMLYAHKEHLPQFADKIQEIEENQTEDVEYVDELMKSN
jgi:6-phospho-beta-glucosidase